MARRKKSKQRKRPPPPHPFEQLADPRAHFYEVAAIGDQPVTAPTGVGIAEPVRLDSGDVLMFPSPNPTAFFLITAKRFRDAAEPLREAAITNTKRVKRGDGAEAAMPTDEAGLFDALEGLSIAVILSAASIEAYANFAIFSLAEEASVEVERRGISVVYERDSMVRALGLGEKLALAVPLHTGRASIKGTTAWETYVELNRLRGELVHLKRRVENNPDDPSAFGRLLLRHGSHAPEDAAEVLEALDPAILTPRIRRELGL